MIPCDHLRGLYDHIIALGYTPEVSRPYPDSLTLVFHFEVVLDLTEMSEYVDHDRRVWSFTEPASHGFPFEGFRCEHHRHVVTWLTKHDRMPREKPLENPAADPSV